MKPSSARRRLGGRQRGWDGRSQDRSAGSRTRGRSRTLLRSR